MDDRHISKNGLIKLALSRYVIALLMIGAIFFLTAGTLAYWEGWMYLATIFIPMAGLLAYLIRHDPELLERRMRMKEKTSPQSLFVLLALIPAVAVFTLPGLDYRFGWSRVPVWVAVAADILVLLGYSMEIWVLKVNSYASRVVEVEKGQKLIQNGPYALVRHPMYLGGIVVYAFTPLALGSLWAVIAGLLIAPVLIARAIHEETILVKDLEGYPEYQQKVRFRLFPGIW